MPSSPLAPGDHTTHAPGLTQPSIGRPSLKGFTEKRKAEKERKSKEGREAAERQAARDHDLARDEAGRAHQKDLLTLQHKLGLREEAFRHSLADPDQIHSGREAVRNNALRLGGAGGRIHDIAAVVKDNNPVTVHQPANVDSDTNKNSRLGNPNQFVGMPGMPKTKSKASAPKTSQAPRATRPSSVALAAQAVGAQARRDQQNVQLARPKANRMDEPEHPDAAYGDVDRSTMHRVPEGEHHKLIGGPHAGALQLANSHFGQPVEVGHSVFMGPRHGRVVKVNRQNVNVKFPDDN